MYYFFFVQNGDQLLWTSHTGIWELCKSVTVKPLVFSFLLFYTHPTQNYYLKNPDS